MKPPAQRLAAPPRSEPGEAKLSKWGLDEGDLSLIRWLLDLTPTDRLRYAQGFAQSVNILRNGRPARS